MIRLEKLQAMAKEWTEYNQGRYESIARLDMNLQWMGVDMLTVARFATRLALEMEVEKALDACERGEAMDTSLEAWLKKLDEIDKKLEKEWKKVEKIKERAR